MQLHKNSGFLWVLLAAILGVCTYYSWQFMQCMGTIGCIFAEDFAPFYRTASEVAAGHADHIYTTKSAVEWIVNAAEGFQYHPFLYPPQSLFLLYPLGFLCEWSAMLVWCVAPVLLLAASLNTIYSKQLLLYDKNQRLRHWLILTVLFMPFVIMSTLAGQSGVLSAALFILVLSWRNSRPILAGLTLAIFSCKPQIAALLPLLLLTEKNWKVLLVALAAVACAITLSIGVWGTGIWQQYHALTTLAWQITASAPGKYTNVSASPFMALRMLGTPEQTAEIIQLCVSLTVGSIALYLSARIKNEQLTVMLLTTATFLVLPYVWIYESATLALCCAILFNLEARGQATAFERIALVLLAFLPIVAIKLQPVHIPYSVLSIAIGFIVVVAHTKRTSRVDDNHA